MMRSMRIFLMTSACLILGFTVAARAQVNPLNTRTLPNDIGGDSSAGDNPLVMKDNGFLRRVTDSTAGQIEIGKLAVSKAVGDDVKKLGQKIVDDRTSLNGSFEKTASAAGVKPAKKLSKADQQELAKLNGLSGADFDKEFLAYVTKVNHRDLEDCKLEASTGGSGQVKHLASIGATTVSNLADESDKLAAANGVSVPKK